METVTSSRGGVKAKYQGHCYTKTKTSGDSIYWKCTQSYKMGCRGTMKCSIILSDPVATHAHNHSPVDEEFALAQARNNMKEEARSSREKPELVYRRNTTDLNEVTIAALKRKKSYKRFVKIFFYCR